MGEKVAIVGVAQTVFRSARPEVNYGELAHEVISRVLTDTGLSIEEDIDNSISCSHDIWDGQTISNIGITDVIGGHLRNEEKMAMDGSTAVYYGTIGILSGEFRCTLLLAHTKMSQTRPNIVNNVAFDPIYSRRLGLDYTSAAALQATRYMRRYNITSEQMARVSVKNLKNARRNVHAMVKRDITVADVLKSPPLADPIRELDAAPDCDGAVAMILADETLAPRITYRPAWIRGIGACYDAHYLGDRDLSECMALERAAQRAYAMAGIQDPASEIDVVELGDVFSYQELLWTEGLGLCERGGGAGLLLSGTTQLDGRIPVNPSGGVLSGVPANVMGLNSAAEAARQVMGSAESHQVPTVGTAVAQGHSGFCGQHHCVIVLGNES